jgi:hypothetical protein
MHASNAPSMSFASLVVEKARWITERAPRLRLAPIAKRSARVVICEHQLK